MTVTEQGQIVLSQEEAEVLLRALRITDEMTVRYTLSNRRYPSGRASEAANAAKTALFNMLNVVSAYMDDDEAKAVLAEWLGRYKQSTPDRKEPA